MAAKNPKLKDTPWLQEQPKVYEAVRTDPRQTSIFGERHEQEVQNSYKNPLLKKKALDAMLDELAENGLGGGSRPPLEAQRKKVNPLPGEYNPPEDKGTEFSSQTNQIIIPAKDLIQASEFEVSASGIRRVASKSGHSPEWEHIQDFLSTQDYRWLGRVSNGTEMWGNSKQQIVYDPATRSWQRRSEGKVDFNGVVEELESKLTTHELSHTAKTADWRKAKDIQRGDTIVSGGAMRVQRVFPEGDEIVVLGTGGALRRFNPEDEISLWRKNAKKTCVACECGGCIKHDKTATEPWCNGCDHAKKECTCEGCQCPENPNRKSAAGKELYHVTNTKSVSNIRAKGILPMQTSNWIKGQKGERYGGGYIYAMESPESAVRWAGKMDWEFNKAMGTGKISIVVFDPIDGEWEEDTADPMSQVLHNGRWLKSLGSVKPQQIKKIIPVTIDMTRAVVQGKPVSLEGDNEMEKEADTKSYGKGTPIGGTPNEYGAADDPTNDEAENASMDMIAAAGDKMKFKAKLNKKALVEMHESPTMLPPRDDLKSHIDQGEQDAITNDVMEGVAPERPSTRRPGQIDPRINPTGRTASKTSANPNKTVRDWRRKNPNDSIPENEKRPIDPFIDWWVAEIREGRTYNNSLEEARTAFEQTNKQAKIARTSYLSPGLPPAKDTAEEYCWVFHPNWGFFFMKGLENYHFKFFKGSGKECPRATIPYRFYDDCNRGYGWVDRADHSVLLKSSTNVQPELAFIPDKVVSGFKEAFPKYAVTTERAKYAPSAPQPSQPQYMHAALDEDESGEYFLDQTQDAENEAKRHFMQEEYIQQLCDDYIPAKTMDEMWDMMGEEYTAEFYGYPYRRVQDFTDAGQGGEDRKVKDDATGNAGLFTALGSCPICKSTNVSAVKDDLKGRKTGSVLAECRDCDGLYSLLSH